jgi:hypothetical protein
MRVPDGPEDTDAHVYRYLAYTKYASAAAVMQKQQPAAAAASEQLTANVCALVFAKGVVPANKRLRVPDGQQEMDAHAYRYLQSNYPAAAAAMAQQSPALDGAAAQLSLDVCALVCGDGETLAKPPPSTAKAPAARAPAESEDDKLVIKSGLDEFRKSRYARTPEIITGRAGSAARRPGPDEPSSTAPNETDGGEAPAVQPTPPAPPATAQVDSDDDKDFVAKNGFAPGRGGGGGGFAGRGGFGDRGGFAARGAGFGNRGGFADRGGGFGDRGRGGFADRDGSGGGGGGGFAARGGGGGGAESDRDNFSPRGGRGFAGGFAHLREKFSRFDYEDGKTSTKFDDE